MVNREPVEICPTMKISPDEDKELDIAFKECKVKIVSVKDVPKTEFGAKVLAILTDVKDNSKFSIFLNNESIKNMSEAWGSNDDNWKGKIADLKKEKDKKYKKEMIVVHPVTD